MYRPLDPYLRVTSPCRRLLVPTSKSNTHVDLSSSSHVSVHVEVYKWIIQALSTSSDFLLCWLVHEAWHGIRARLGFSVHTSQLPCREFRLIFPWSPTAPRTRVSMLQFPMLLSLPRRTLCCPTSILWLLARLRCTAPDRYHAAVSRSVTGDDSPCRCLCPVLL
jgi:hypothetical protein